MTLSEIFNKMLERKASDLYLRTCAQPRVRVDGEIEVLDEEVISKEKMQAFTNLLLDNEQRKQQFLENLDVDFIHEEEGDMGRFRINIFMQRGTPAVVARHVHAKVESFEELSLPIDVCKLFCEESRGMFLACGPAGNGKSTTIASMLEYINQNRAEHIITIEDPIEFLFKDKKSLISQRELDLDVHSYPLALKHVTQQSPDIIFIGNVRDEATMRAAITATELGAFVMSTFHTVNAVQTIMRIVNFFPPYLHDEIRMQLSLILKGTISLRLLARKDGNGRAPAFETMVVTPSIARLIREGSVREIQGFIDEGEMFGMQSFKQSLVGLVKAGIVEEKEARQYADSKDDFDLELKGITK
ncbi:Twitching motility protein PilT [hydrothermal vent metagenome]|uniref:Twitching motility protein PilT n=1 Tax=hydrothermal vent metagenome TaxID=652676 RepID=A0A3B1DNK2_9ZZZZ